MLRTIGRRLLSHSDIAKLPACRTLTHYPIDESIFGLTEDQIQVSHFHNSILGLIGHVDLWVKHSSVAFK